MKRELSASRENKEVRNQVELEVESQSEDTEIRRQPQEHEFTEEEEFVDKYSISRDKPTRVMRLPFKLNERVSFALTFAEDIVYFEPRNYKEAAIGK